METDPNATPMAWAASLNQKELALQLRRLAANPHALDADERRAVCTIAADDLEREDIRVKPTCKHPRWADTEHCAEMTCSNYIEKHR